MGIHYLSQDFHMILAVTLPHGLVAEECRDILQIAGAADHRHAHAFPDERKVTATKSRNHDLPAPTGIGEVPGDPFDAHQTRHGNVQDLQHVVEAGLHFLQSEPEGICGQFAGHEQVIRHFQIPVNLQKRETRVETMQLGIVYFRTERFLFMASGCSVRA